MVKRKSNKISHFLTYYQKKRRNDTCLKLIVKPHDYGFLTQIVTTDEKWIYFRNSDKSGQWVNRDSRAEPHPKQGQFEKKVMLSIFSIYSHMVKQWILNTIVIYSNGYMLPLWIGNELFCNKIMLVHIHKKWPWIKSRNWMTLNFYLILLIVQTWHLQILFKDIRNFKISFRTAIFLIIFNTDEKDYFVNTFLQRSLNHVDNYISIWHFHK